MTADERTVESMMDAEFTRQVGRMADHLRRYAERIEMAGRRTVDHRGRANHVMVVAEIQSEINSMFGNSPMWNLLAAANDAQRYYDETPALNPRNPA